MAMYGIGDRPGFVDYSNGLTGTKQGASSFGQSSKRYYSSLDAEIYFGDYYVDDIVHIAYQVEQSTQTLFGYNSYVYDEVALGSRLINGSFTINFTRPEYLFDLLAQLESDAVVIDTEQNVEKENDGSEEAESTSEPIKTGSNSATSTDYTAIKKDKRPLWFTGFDIDVMLGQENTQGGAKHVMLEGVYITGSGLGLDPSGAPVTETYSFIARDIRPIG